MSLHCMLDLETWSKKPNAQIVSIGAVKFDPLDPNVEVDAFHVAIDPSREVTAPGTFDIDADTMLWWLADDRAAARSRWLALTKMDLGTALDGFAAWYGTEDIPVWGNGATFDNVILTQSYELLRLERPWSYRMDRCYRTLKAISNVQAVQPPGLENAPHDALFDAIYQAMHMGIIVRDMVR